MLSLSEEAEKTTVKFNLYLEYESMSLSQDAIDTFAKNMRAYNGQQ